MQRVVFIISLFTFITANSIIFASEFSLERRGPQLLFYPPPFLTLEQLDISITYPKGRKVRIEYSVKNNSGKDYSGLLHFDIPERNWYGYSEWYTNRSFSDLTVWVNGISVKYETYNIAFLGEKDVSAELKTAGLEFNLIDMGEDELMEAHAVKVTTENINKFQKLHDAGLIHGQPEPLKASDSFWFEPAWSVVTFHYWKQNFPANSLTKIVYQYEPLPGLALPPAEALEPPSGFMRPSGYETPGELLENVGTNWPEVLFFFQMHNPIAIGCDG